MIIALNVVFHWRPRDWHPWSYHTCSCTGEILRSCTAEAECTLTQHWADIAGNGRASFPMWATHRIQVTSILVKKTWSSRFLVTICYFVFVVCFFSVILSMSFVTTVFYRNNYYVIDSRLQLNAAQFPADTAWHFILCRFTARYSLLCSLSP